LTAEPGSTPFFKVADMNAGDGHFMADARVMISEDTVSTLSLRVFPPGSVIFPKVGGALHTNKKRVLTRPSAVDTNTMVAVPTNAIDDGYLYYWLSAIRLSDYAHGSPVPSIKRVQLAEADLALPPFREQKRIVAAIEEQFSRLDAGVAVLWRVRQNLRRMRAAALETVVKDAFASTGGVSQAVAELLRAKLANGKSVPDGPPDGFPVLRLTAVRDGEIDVSCAKAGAWTSEQANPYLIAKGDYLVVRGNGSKQLVGRGGLVDVDAATAYPDTLIRVRFDHDKVLAEYAALLWESAFVRRQIEAAARTTAGIYKINQRDLEQLELPIPVISEQLRLLTKGDALLSRVKRLVDALGAEDARIRGLKSAILAAGFAGRLTAQDPNDEPASVLLERTAAERGSSNGKSLKAPQRRRKVEA
jgi:type I restriction enzyme, S subunit